MDDQSRLRTLADAAISRRNELGLTQAELAAEGGISLATVQAVEAARGGVRMRPKTVTGLERGLLWKPGSVHKVLDGDRPECINLQEAFVDLLSILRADGGMSEPLAWRIGDSEKASPRSLGRALYRLFADRPDSAAEVRALVEDELQWVPGSIQKMFEADKPAPEPDLEVAGLMAVVQREWQDRLRRESQIRPHGLGYEDARVIAASGLPEEDTKFLIEHAIRRREQFEGQLAAELTHLISVLRTRR